MNFPMPDNWRQTLTGAFNAFTPDPPLPGVASCKADLTKGTGPYYTWGISVTCENGEKITLRGEGGKDLAVAGARCEAAWPAVACFAASRATVKHHRDPETD